jgi:hypothetical protein
MDYSFLIGIRHCNESDFQNNDIFKQPNQTFLTSFGYWITTAVDYRPKETELEPTNNNERIEKKRRNKLQRKSI